MNRRRAAGERSYMRFSGFTRLRGAITQAV